MSQEVLALQIRDKIRNLDYTSYQRIIFDEIQDNSFTPTTQHAAFDSCSQS